MTLKKKKFMSTKKLDDFNQDYNSDKKLLIQFSAAWCSRCKQIKPKVEELVSNHQKIKFIQIDIDDESFKEVVQKFGIRTLPTFALVHKTKVVEIFSGSDITKAQDRLKTSLNTFEQHEA